MPTYLQKQLHFSMTSSGIIAFLPYMLRPVMNVVCGISADALATKGILSMTGILFLFLFFYLILRLLLPSFPFSADAATKGIISMTGVALILRFFPFPPLSFLLSHLLVTHQRLSTSLHPINNFVQSSFVLFFPISSSYRSPSSLLHFLPSLSVVRKIFQAAACLFPSALLVTIVYGDLSAIQAAGLVVLPHSAFLFPSFSFFFSPFILPFQLVHFFRSFRLLSSSCCSFSFPSSTLSPVRLLM